MLPTEYVEHLEQKGSNIWNSVQDMQELDKAMWNLVVTSLPKSNFLVSNRLYLEQFNLPPKNSLRKSENKGNEH